ATGPRCGGGCALEGGSGCRSGRRGATSACDGFVGDVCEAGGCGADGCDAAGCDGVSRGVNAGGAAVFCRPAETGGALRGADGASRRINADKPANPSTSAEAPYTIKVLNDARGRAVDLA